MNAIYSNTHSTVGVFYTHIHRGTHAGEDGARGTDILSTMHLNFGENKYNMKDDVVFASSARYTNTFL